MEEIKLAIVVQQQGKRRHFVVEKDLVTIGKSDDCEIVIQEDIPGLEKKHTLFSYNSLSNSYELYVKPELFRGWVKIGEDEISVKDLSLKAKVRKEGDLVILPLPTTSRGRIQIGRTVIGYGFQSFAKLAEKKNISEIPSPSVGWVEVIKSGSLKKYIVKKNQVFLVGNTARSAIKESSFERELRLFSYSESGFFLTIIPGFVGVLNKNGERIRIDEDTFAKDGSIEKKFSIAAGDRADLKYKNSFIVRLGVREEVVPKEVQKEIAAPAPPEEKQQPIEKEPGKPKWERFNNRPHDRLTVGEDDRDKKQFAIFNFTVVLFWILWMVYAYTIKVQAMDINLATAEETLKRLEESDLLDVSMSEDIESLRRGTLGMTTGGEGTGEGEGSGTGSGSGSGSGYGSGAGGGTIGQGGQTSRVARGLRVLGVGSGPSTGPIGLGGGDASIQDLLAGGASLSGVSGGASSAAGGAGGIGGGVTGTVGITGGTEISTGNATGAELQHQRIAGVRGGSIADLSGSAVASGARDPADVRRTIVRYQGRLKYFYEKELEVNPSLQGKIVVRITISEEGFVSNVSLVSSTLGSPSLEQQIISAISGWSFGAIDPGGGEFTFTVPFNFYSQ